MVGWTGVYLFTENGCWKKWVARLRQLRSRSFPSTVLHAVLVKLAFGLKYAEHNQDHLVDLTVGSVFDLTYWAVVVMMKLSELCSSAFNFCNAVFPHSLVGAQIWLWWHAVYSCLGLWKHQHYLESITINFSALKHEQMFLRLLFLPQLFTSVLLFSVTVSVCVLTPVCKCWAISNT